ncbi:MAG: Nif3-like dinuclear metal center hexameric protein [Epsilonproteobacteria bacterium]|nr:Nif3-like dinuclear metal center hexameric protein [Campylobacterota bacterium]
MKLKDIYDILNRISPFELQERWDNSGLIIGELDRDIKDIYISLEVTRDALLNSPENSLFIVHHPLIFSPQKSLNFSRYPSNLIEIMVRRGQSLIALHTNFDKSHLNRYLFENVLGFRDELNRDFVAGCRVEMSGRELISRVKSKLNIKSLRVVYPKDSIGSIAMTTGSGASLIDTVESDCFLTGDIRYHDAMNAISRGLMLIDIGHYESEIFFSHILKDELENLEVSAIICELKNPFEIV